jgi:hypothetical protein
MLAHGVGSIIDSLRRDARVKQGRPGDLGVGSPGGGDRAQGTVGGLDAVYLGQGLVQRAEVGARRAPQQRPVDVEEEQEHARRGSALE